ncbi:MULTISPECIES: LysE family translocator [unclassified Acinetobacter]|uniref:LysE family translocator n=1 Tax=unclassified Acinetobacter TaxID=196816 RepID=UPI00102308CF|nr:MULTISPECIES: LysE family translocator [unclassified Acinetobacter]RZG76878.1 LysE family translocator [Acinetobacter sp. WCHAc060025]RZG84541.1 LysE family translocator [Acinetobacter sp. WCHAc060033]
MNYLELYLYVITVIIMIATPGPVMILVASAGLKGGYRKALQTIIGTNLASLVLIAASILILKGMFSVNETLFLIIKILGCFYIAYLGYDILKDVSSQKNDQAETVLSPVDGGVVKGFLVGISNPKDIIFFSSFFPQFIGIHANINISLAILVIAWIILDFLTLSLVYLSFNKLAKSKLYAKVLGLCGVILIVIAVYGLYVSLKSLI